MRGCWPGTGTARSSSAAQRRPQPLRQRTCQSSPYVSRCTRPADIAKPARAPRTAPAAWTGSFGSLPLAEVVVDDVRVANRVSALISAVGVLASVMLVVAGTRECCSGASILWLVAGAVIFLSALYTLVRDVRRLSTGPTA